MSIDRKDIPEEKRSVRAEMAVTQELIDAALAWDEIVRTPRDEGNLHALSAEENRKALELQEAVRRYRELTQQSP